MDSGFLRSLGATIVLRGKTTLFRLLLKGRGCSGGCQSRLPGLVGQEPAGALAGAAPPGGPAGTVPGGAGSGRIQGPRWGGRTCRAVSARAGGWVHLSLTKCFMESVTHSSEAGQRFFLNCNRWNWALPSCYPSWDHQAAGTQASPGGGGGGSKTTQGLWGRRRLILVAKASPRWTQVQGAGK